MTARTGTNTFSNRLKQNLRMQAYAKKDLL
jgi:hypothetical protein